MAVGRVAGTGNIGYSSNYRGGGRSYHGGINEEIIWISIGMAITIGILITLALIYLAYEKCQKRRNHYIHA
ncbi:uncharacterized protein LOC134215888 [Armigeres subalbatus]|uniref:Uncharacterized protein n=2 Tax=Stegomyia TaxID=53541 RepID=A0A6I8TT41_AEDAE|nr:uncharacterized protein LOC110676378 [Aedes aegypti]XP_021699722.1 uncharacterized protein LOC110676378 [Aedes aegypti]XP_029729038.1 uncharacterized protein LOC109411152 [Aedes albopictus]